MKIQLSSASLRVRILESELAMLVGGGDLLLSPRPFGVPMCEVIVSLSIGNSLNIGFRWHVQFDRAEVMEYIETLPRRDALRFEARHSGTNGCAFRVELEVDVRDSIAIRRRGSTRLV